VGELIGPLLAHSEHFSDFGDADHVIACADKFGEVVGQGTGRENVDSHDSWERTSDRQRTHHRIRDHHERQPSDGQ
jgi:hypothetical protein